MNFFKRSRTFVTLNTAIVLAGGMLQLLPEKHLESDLFWSEKRYGKQRYDALLMGDSRTYLGVSPEILREYIPNMDIYNFGFSAGRINRQLIDSGSKRLQQNGKRILIFGCTYLDLCNSRNEHFFSIVKEAPLRNTWIQKNTPFNEYYTPHTPFGYVESRHSKNADAFLCGLKEYRDGFSVRPFLPSDFKHFVQNLKWCKRNNIKVVAYRMVSCREMDELEDKLSGVDWDKIKQAVLDEGFVWLERPPSPLLEQIEEHCYDASHLNAEGAELFSNWLGQELAKLDWFKDNQQTAETKK